MFTSSRPKADVFLQFPFSKRHDQRRQAGLNTNVKYSVNLYLKASQDVSTLKYVNRVVMWE